MNKGKVLELNVVLEGLKDLGTTKFRYFVIKNLNVLKNQVEVLKEIEQINKAILTDLEKDRNDLILKIGKKGSNNVYIDVEDKEMVKLFNEEFTTIVEKHKDKLDEFEDASKEFSKLLEEEVEVEEELNFRTISVEECPEEGVNSTSLELLLEHNLIT